MKLEVGMYVITNNRMKIGKIKDFCYCEMCKRREFYEPIIDNDIYITNYDKDNNFADYNFYDNITDLIEVGDYVNGLLVTRICFDEKTNKKYINLYGSMSEWEEEDIKTILTKEQFEANVYRIGE